MDVEVWGEINSPASSNLHQLWGEIAVSGKAGLSRQEREALAMIPQVPLLEGPKLFQPEPQRHKVKSETGLQQSILIKNIELLRYRRQLTRLLETLEQHKKAVAAGELDQLPPLPQPPPQPELKPFKRSTKSTLFGFPSKEQETSEEGEQRVKEDPDLSLNKRLEVPEISTKDAEQGLRKAVIRISAHVGYHTAEDSGVRVLTEATELFLQRLTASLRRALDTDLQTNHAGTGWGDILEQVFNESGVGSILDVQDHYENNVIKQHFRLIEQCRELRESYVSEVPGEVGDWIAQEDDIPEMHFPSSDEGAGLGESLPNHATPTLDVGMQMLQSLEASGDLVDTPLSGDSEALSVLSCATPSPALTPRNSTGSPQFNSSKKRRRSGGKFS